MSFGIVITVKTLMVVVITTPEEKFSIKENPNPCVFLILITLDTLTLLLR